MWAYGAGSYSYAAASPSGTSKNTVSLGRSGSVTLANAAPYVENDKTARLSAVFEGVSGVFTSLGDAYARIKYNAQPVGAPSRTAPPLYSDAGPGYAAFDAQGNPITTGPSIFQNKLLWIIGGVLIIAYFVARKR